MRVTSADYLARAQCCADPWLGDFSTVQLFSAPEGEEAGPWHPHPRGFRTFKLHTSSIAAIHTPL